MAQWSEQEIARRKQDRIKDALMERAELFGRFRAGGWTISVIDPLVDRAFNILPDNYPKIDPHYLVKMPGAHPMRIKTVTQLYRLAKGVA